MPGNRLRRSRRAAPMEPVRPGERAAALILDVLASSSRPLSAYEILDRMRSHGMTAAPTIYRPLDRLAGSGRVHRVETLRAFVARSPRPEGGRDDADGLSTIYAICEACGCVREVSDPELRSRLREQAVKGAFTPRCGTVEVVGICSTCNPARERPAGKPRTRASGFASIRRVDGSSGGAGHDP